MWLVGGWLSTASGAPAPERPNVVMISLDTTRADALSCYGVPPGPYRMRTDTTPVLDAIAAEGARFARFYAHAPSTLSSHASMLTGLDPHGHAVPRNGFPLAAPIPTLPERLGAAGWDTIGVVGSAALESGMGLDRGFRVYDDTLEGRRGPMVQASAENVVARALANVDARPDADQPLFLFVHFYDPHAPYTPPPAFEAQYTDPSYTGNVVADGPTFKEFTGRVRKGLAAPEDLAHVAQLYLAEVAYVDQQVGVLLDGLRSRKILDHALLVVVADHGETLAEQPSYAWSHGSNVAYEVMHVPLILRGYGVPIAERAVIRRQAAMNGLPGTILALLGLPDDLGDGLPFPELVRAGPFRDDDGWPERPTIPVFVEATRPRSAERDDRWNNKRMHRGVFAGGYAAFSSPFLKLRTRFYDRGRPPSAAIRDVLEALVTGWDDRAPGYVAPTMTDATRQALKELGYVE